MLVSKGTIPQGNEITVNYGYPFASGPLWYKLLMKKTVQENSSQWYADPTLWKLTNNVNILQWNISNEFVSFNFTDVINRKRYTKYNSS